MTSSAAVLAQLAKKRSKSGVVKKGVSWALRGIGHRNPKLRAAAMKTATRLSQSEIASARWIGKDAIRDLGR
jgi:3-methyladenine DNA glycosylase AlkD